MEPWSCAADELVSVADELSVSFCELASVLLESVCVLVLASVLVALESDPLSWTTTTLVLLDGLSSVF